MDGIIVIGTADTTGMYTMSGLGLRDALRVTTAGASLLRSAGSSTGIGVDRTRGIIRGFVVMQLGLLKDRPGEVDRTTLDGIVTLGNAATRGIRSHYTHGNLCEDQLGSFLGRVFSFRLSSAKDATGKYVDAVRADLHFDRTALETPPKGGGKALGVYVMDLAESDSDALSSSVAAKFKKEYRLKADGTKAKNPETGEELPPLWRVQQLYAADIVSQGAAVDGLLSFDGLRDDYLWQASDLLSRLLTEGRLGTLSRREIEQRLTGWMTRALDSHFGDDRPMLDARSLRLRQRLREYETMLIEQQMAGVR
jgi:hypothetical protein